MSGEKSNYIHTIDIGLLRFNSEEKQIEILLTLREKQPFEGQWALPGIVINGDQRDNSIRTALTRLMTSPKVGFEAKYYEQVGTTDEDNDTRDPRCWSSSTYYMGIVDEHIRLQPHQRFVSLDSISNGQEKIAFDHNVLVNNIQERLIAKSTYSSLPILFLGELFTVLDTVNVCTAIMHMETPKIGQRKRCERLSELGFIEKTDLKTQPARGAPQSQMRTLITDKLHYFNRSINS
jgi:ADP-ribose pyrophosphatase YjhB (NUDIX family)